MGMDNWEILPQFSGAWNDWIGVLDFHAYSDLRSTQSENKANLIGFFDRVLSLSHGPRNMVKLVVSIDFKFYF